eukprot:scaffold62694_cov28-Prasinocladus_malaysianus.AAC.1
MHAYACSAAPAGVFKWCNICHKCHTKGLLALDAGRFWSDGFAWIGLLGEATTQLTLNANRHVTGVMRGFDQFMNIVLDNAIDERMKADIGMVVIRGNSIVTIEALEKIV